MSSTNALFQASNPYSELIDQLIQLESRPKQRLEQKVEQQQTRKSAISSVGSKLSTLNGLFDSYLGLNANQFEAFSAGSSNESAFTVETTTSLDGAGTYDINVNQIAKNDIKVSKQFNTSDTISGLDAAENRTFRIKVGGEYVDFNGDGTADSNDTITISGIADGDTYESVIQQVANQINDSVASQDVTATVLRENSDTVRLSVRSDETGKENLVEFENDVPASGQNVAEALRLTYAGGPNRGEDKKDVVGDTTQGGRIYQESELNAKFKLDGLSFERSSNEVTDAISGLTINIIQTTSSSEKITVNSDSETIKSNVTDFIDKYNAAVKDIRQKSFLNPDSGERGPLQGDRQLKSLVNSMRNSLMQDVDSSLIPSDEINSIFDIGLDFNRDGTIEIADEAALDQAINNNPEDIQRLFSATDSDNSTTDGIAGRLQGVLDLYLSNNDGILNTLKDSADSKIEVLNNRISREERFLENRREQLQSEFQALQQVAIQAQQQQQSLQSIAPSLYGSGSSGTGTSGFGSL